MIAEPQTLLSAANEPEFYAVVDTHPVAGFVGSTMSELQRIKTWHGYNACSNLFPGWPFLWALYI